MNTEYEIRVLEIDQTKIEEKLNQLGAKYVDSFDQKRYVYDLNPKEKGKWIRLRTNGKKTTLTYKDIVSNTIDGTKEIEVTVSDFEKTNALLNKMGFIHKGYQENKRIRYDLNGCEIDLDFWPLIPPYLEIEASSEEEVLQVLKLLELEEEKVTTLNCEDIYLEFYDIDINKKGIKVLKKENVNSLS